MRTHVIAEVGINHNGSVDTARQLIAAAAVAGADSVKFQKRTPELCVPKAEWVRPRDTPWGTMPYIEYKRRMEFDVPTYVELCSYANTRGLAAFFSVWDEGALADVLSIQARGRELHPWLKVPSAKLTDHKLVAAVARECRGLASSLMLSTGMSTAEEVTRAYLLARNAPLDASRMTLMHCHSAYPAPTEELSLRTMHWLADDFPGSRVGYSGHEYGLEPTVWAVVLGAQVVERHITLDHGMWGTDHKASVPPRAFARLVEHIRAAEQALGAPGKRLWDSELPARRKLRGEAEVVAQ